MPDELRHAERAAGVSSRRLDPQSPERALAQEAPVGHAVERHAAGETQVLHPGLPLYRARHAQQDLLAHDLDRAREVHLTLRELGFGHPRRPSEELVEGTVRHGEAGEVVEVLLVERERAVLTQVHELAADDIHVPGLTVGREAHDLVFARVHLEARSEEHTSELQSLTNLVCRLLLDKKKTDNT